MFLNDDDMVECPYNNTHRMLRKRFQAHLIKCRQQYKDVELRKCPFNITHLVPEPEYSHHARNCPDRHLITQYKYDAPEQKEEEVPKHAPIECDDNWDDTDVNDYNPRLNLETSKVILKADGTCQSERKLFIKKERIRLGDDEDSSDDGSKSEVNPSRRKPQKYEFYKDYGETRPDNYDQKTVFRYNRSISRCSSSLSRHRSRSRSPIVKVNNKNILHPPTFGRKSREYSPPKRSSTRNYFLPNHSDSDTAHDQYHRKDRSTPNNDQYNNGGDYDCSNRGYQEYHLSRIPLSRSRSPIVKANNKNILHPPTFGRKSREYSPPKRSSTRNYFLPNHSDSDTAHDQYHRKDRSTPNNDQYNNGGDYDCSNRGYQEYQDSHSETNYVMPEAPPPPIISHPTPKTYLSKGPYPPFSKR